jgi:hypothetical protein
MNPFERHGITHLSPSSLNLYAANPRLWVGRYLQKWEDEAGPAAFRGSSIEAGLDKWLFERDAKAAEQIALAKFALITDGQADEAHEAERAVIPAMLAQAITALTDHQIPVARQLKVEYWANGLEVPIIGYIDYLWEDFGIDLKTTKACPSAIKADHARQVALYATVKERPFKVLYATAKKHAIYEQTVEERALHMHDLERQARAVRHLLKHSEDADDAARFFAPAREDFRWSEQTLKMAEVA